MSGLKNLFLAFVSLGVAMFVNPKVARADWLDCVAECPGLPDNECTSDCLDAYSANEDCILDCDGEWGSPNDPDDPPDEDPAAYCCYEEY